MTVPLPGWSLPFARGPAGRLLAPAAVALAATAAVGYVGVVDPNLAGHYPACPFLALTGLYCPGCGSLRAVHALAHGHLAEAAGFNVLTCLAVPWLVLAWVTWSRRLATGRPRPQRAAPGWLIWALLVAVIAFWLLRNAAAFAALAP
jgi:Protein of unknown function (DUF2752)